MRKSVQDLKDNPIGQRDFLRLEAPPMIIQDVDKDKGIVFDYSLKNVEEHIAKRKEQGRAKTLTIMSEPWEGRAAADISLEVFDSSTGFSTGVTNANSSGTSKLMGGKRYRPPKRMRRFKPKPRGSFSAEEKGKSIDLETEKTVVKRRAAEVAGEFMRVAKRSNTEVVPHEGLPNQ